MAKNAAVQDSKSESKQGFIASETANRLEGFQIHKYRPEKSGHGFAAEDANAFEDRIRLKKVEITGTNNEKNGSDRITNSVPIQTKYYECASKTVNSAFDAETGLYRYNGQMLEVPKDQYEQSIQHMRDKIAQGKVEGYTNPDDAEKIVKSGSVSYQQARNIARAGNIDSIIFDSKTQAVSSGYVFAVSFAISYARCKWNGEDNKNALRGAVESSITAAGTTFLTGIIAAQVLRTRTAAVGTVIARSGVKSAYHTTIGKKAIEKIATASLGKAVYGAAAYNHVSRLLRSNVVTSTIVTALTTAPDFYRATLSNKISWPQFSKNLIVNVSGVASGAAGWAAGAALGASIGSAFFPVAGTAVGGAIGGIAGAFSAGTTGSIAANKVADCFIVDDAQKMMEIVKDVTEKLCEEHLLTENEIEQLVKMIKKEITPKWLMNMFKAGAKKGKEKERFDYAYSSIDKMCLSITTKRPTISLPSIETVQEQIDNIVESIPEESPEMT